MTTEVTQLHDSLGGSADELTKRQLRWHSFKIIFTLAYAGVVLDIVTTALGFRVVGASYEQNPLGGGLIQSLGWPGMLALLSGFCLVLFFSYRVICFNMALRVSGWISSLLAIATFVRWVAIVTAVLYIVQSS